MTSKQIVIIWIVVSLVITSLVLAGDPPATAPAATAPAATVRVGTFDRRALVIAYYGSELNEEPLRELMAWQQKAKAEGSEQLVKELEQQGVAKQDLAHKQFAGEAPLDSIMADLKSAWPEVAAAANADVIVLEPPLYTRPGVEVVDVTDALVDQINPNERARGFIRDLRKGKQP